VVNEYVTSNFNIKGAIEMNKMIRVANVLCGLAFSVTAIAQQSQPYIPPVVCQPGVNCNQQKSTTTTTTNTIPPVVKADPPANNANLNPAPNNNSSSNTTKNSTGTMSCTGLPKCKPNHGPGADGCCP